MPLDPAVAGPSPPDLTSSPFSPSDRSSPEPLDPPANHLRTPPPRSSPSPSPMPPRRTASPASPSSPTPSTSPAAPSLQISVRPRPRPPPSLPQIEADRTHAHPRVGHAVAPPFCSWPCPAVSTATSPPLFPQVTAHVVLPVAVLAAPRARPRPRARSRMPCRGYPRTAALFGRPPVPATTPRHAAAPAPATRPLRPRPRARSGPVPASPCPDFAQWPRARGKAVAGRPQPPPHPGSLTTGAPALAR
nr:vegetative cell wall protein gp1-like [Aegilops tauschii subsp. strangulata]